MKIHNLFKYIVLIYLSIGLSLPIKADSSSPLLAAYYDKFMAICNGKVFTWNNNEKPKELLSKGKKVGVGKSNSYVLTGQNELLAWEDVYKTPDKVLGGIKSFYAGRSGIFVIKNDDSLWHIETESVLGFGEKLSKNIFLVSENILTGSIGDSADYYVTHDGSLFVKGLAHRGQYGDGKLTETKNYEKTADDVIQVVSNTGHALILKKDGSVWGTGGNIYGPLGKHGYGDKAISWGKVFDGALSIATGSSHTLAIKPDGSLWIWGRNEGLSPKKVMENVVAVAAGSKASIALSDGALWQWDRGEEPSNIMSCKY